MTKLSIVVPVYNVEKYIIQCIESLLNQSSSDYEIILIDDGSTDSSGLICDEYRFHNNIIIKHIENHGVSYARNLGINLATGKYISFVDSDDFVTHDYVKQMLAVGDEYDIVYFTDCKKKTYEHSFDIQQMELLRRYIWNRSAQIIGLNIPFFGTPWTKRYKKEIVEKNNISFQLDIHPMEDTIFNADYLNNSTSAICVCANIYEYRVVAQSASRAPRKDRYLNLHKCISAVSSKSYFKNYEEDIYVWFFVLVWFAISHQTFNKSFDNKYTRMCNEFIEALDSDEITLVLEKINKRYLSNKWKIVFLVCKYRFSVCAYLISVMNNFLRKQ